MGAPVAVALQSRATRTADPMNKKPRGQIKSYAVAFSNRKSWTRILGTDQRQE